MTYSVKTAPYRTESDQVDMNLLVIGPWLVYMVISPLYLFPQGTPQVADYVLALAALPTLALVFLNDRKSLNATYLFGFGFVFLTVAVNLINYLYFPHQRLLFSAVYYLYNFIVFIYVVRLFRDGDPRLRDWTRLAIYAAVVMQMFWIVFLPGSHGYRETGSFNNPNQLAYWSVLMGAMLVFIRHGQKLTWQDWGVFGLLAVFEILALSKAGLITYSVFLVALMFMGQVPRIIRALVLMGIMICCIFLIFDRATLLTPLLQGDEVLTAIERVSSIGEEQDDSLEGRGYTRMSKFPEYLLVGAGEGAYTRFDEPRELHSGLATILFSYGIVGFIFFSCFLATIFLRRPYYYLLILLPVMMFSVSSQTIRFTHTWVFFAIAYGVTRHIDHRPKGIPYENSR